MIDIDEIEARLKAATPGPWLVAYDADHPMNGGMPFNFVVATIGNDTIAEDLCGYDARFIAHAPEDVAALIAEVRMLRAENARLREAVPSVTVAEHVRDAVHFAFDRWPARAPAGRDAIAWFARLDAARKGE